MITVREGIAGRFVGARVRRLEDRRLLTGTGHYIDDVVVPGMAHAAFLRSPHAHALITGVDATAARALPGVIAVFTGPDMAEITNPMMGMLVLDGLHDPTYGCVATDRVRMVGDPVALVVAESRRVAEDACERIDVAYEPLPPIGTIAQALDPTRPPIWPKAKGNVVYRGSRTYGDVDAAFATADRVITRRFSQHRLSNQPMETRGAVAEVDPVTGAVTFHAANQSAHMLRWSLGAFVGKATIGQSIKALATTKRDRVRRFARGAKAYLAANPDLMKASRPMTGPMLKSMIRDPGRSLSMTAAMLGLLAKDPTEIPRVVTGDIGGAFGSKTLTAREDVAVCAAAVHLGRSIKWIEDRNENLMVGGHAREEQVEISAAVRNDGTINGLRVRLELDAGAYPGMPYGAALFAQIVRVMMPGPYRIDAIQFDTVVAATNKGTYVAYRGPWAVETWVRERMLDVVARELGLTPAEIRRRNLLQLDELPRPMATGPVVDVRMSAYRTFEEAARVADVGTWPQVQEEARAENRIIGLGMATFMEAAPGPPGYFDHAIPGFAAMVSAEPARAVLEADGTISVVTPQIPHGQGHETTLAQVAADQLGVPVEAVRVRYGDTAQTPFGLMGTGGSRSATMAGGAVQRSSRELRRRIDAIAADLLEAAPEDLVIEDGSVHVIGTPAVRVTLQEVATEARSRGNGSGDMVTIDGAFDGGVGGWSQATHVCWVEIDLETGVVSIPRYLVVEDCGELINPAIVEGQVRGGVAQGIGAVLYEKAAYDDEAQFQTGTYMDYLLPTAMEIPPIEIVHLETPADVEANYRGVGEGGMIAAPAAVTNAIEDALAHLGVEITEQHLPPFRILELAGVIPTPA